MLTAQREVALVLALVGAGVARVNGDMDRKSPIVTVSVETNRMGADLPALTSWRRLQHSHASSATSKRMPRENV